VYDVYFLAIENLPAWWGDSNVIAATVKKVVQDLRIRNPGLEIRQHWITRMAYGRDPNYAPYINKALYTDDAPMPYAYIYPGKVHGFSGTDAFYYDPKRIQGRINVDGTIQNWNAASPSPLQYSLADQFNHAVRYPDELALYQAAVNATPSGQSPPEISWRMLIEYMNTRPDIIANALIVNLHGELLPFPPIRNYSDAAKDPVGSPNIRVVTHPEQLHYGSLSGSNWAALRVYAYLAGNSTATSVPSISLWLPGVQLMDDPGHLAIQKMTTILARITNGRPQSPARTIPWASMRPDR
jgi:hypothetical protein